MVLLHINIRINYLIYKWLWHFWRCLFSAYRKEWQWVEKIINSSFLFQINLSIWKVTTNNISFRINLSVVTALMCLGINALIWLMVVSILFLMCSFMNATAGCPSVWNSISGLFAGPPAPPRVTCSRSRSFWIPRVYYWRIPELTRWPLACQEDSIIWN